MNHLTLILECFDFIQSKNLKITEKDIIDRITDRHRWPIRYHTGAPSVERMLHDGAKLQDFFFPDGWINSQRAVELYVEGYTFIYSGVQYLFPEITEISNEFGKRFKKPMEANLYLSRGTKSVSFPNHNHEYHVIVKNIFGSALWSLDGEDFILKDQEALYIPQNSYHQVKEIYDKKASLTFNIVI